MFKDGLATAFGSLALLLAPGTAQRALAQSSATAASSSSYARMGPVDDYLMPDRAAEIALARSAAPASVSHDAAVQTLGRHGFEMTVKGTNGFLCFVGRSWTSALEADYWNSKVRVPMCVNAAGARSYLVHINAITVMGLEGRTPAQVNKAVGVAVAANKLPPMGRGAMCYMMSKDGFGGDASPHWPSHVMFFFTDTELASWGANLPGSPIAGLNDPVEHLTQFALPVAHWSDGTPVAEVAAHQH